MVEISKEIRRFGNEQIEVIFRKAAPTDTPVPPPFRQIHYEGPKPGTTTLSKGTVLMEGGYPLPCDIVWERDVPVPLHDGIIIYIDFFRPADGSDIPAILSWSPYGKSVPQGPPTGVSTGTVSGLQKFEGPDPGYWCNCGYAVANVDARGAYSSQGDIHFWGAVEARDGYNVIEWVASQEWCNGKVGLSGNSWLAIVQWFIAQEHPPHLAAIAPWEGLSDLYRQDILRGGILNIGFNEMVTSTMRGQNRVEDLPAMAQKYPLMNAYWEDKSAKLEKINAPAYVVASWSNDLHTLGTLEGFRRISSKEKWLRVHNSHEWADYYEPENVEDLRRFFDRYLKSEENDWEQTPQVRVSVLDPGGTDQVKRSESAWPLERTQYEKLFLDAAQGILSTNPMSQESSVRYKADDGQGQASFAIRFDKDMELTGYLKLRLWVEAEGAEDMDLFVLVQKLDAQGSPLSSPNPMGKYLGPNGRQRASHRETDRERSFPWLPHHTHRVQNLLHPGEIVQCDIPIWPTGMLWHAGEQLRLTVSGFNPIPFHLPGIPGPVTRNQGYHIIHTGGKYDSHLLVPVIPS
jgi:predicted acyl esterase